MGVICANQVPDHSTLARFRRDHEDALADLFTEVLALCGKAGLLNVGVIAVDGTTLHANASDHSNLTYEQIAWELLEQVPGRVFVGEEPVSGLRTPS
jgi:Transposase domain (DUF772)